jgi:hypothetical protein
VCCVLSETPKLDYLHIKLDGRGHFNVQSFDRVLESFTLLQKVREVVLDEVPKMYEALQEYAGPFDCCQELLQEACDAMEEDDVKLFTRVIAKTFPVVKKYMKDAEDHLLSMTRDQI